MTLARGWVIGKVSSEEILLVIAPQLADTALALRILARPFHELSALRRPVSLRP